MAESPTSSLTHTFESLRVGKSDEQAAKKKNETRGKKTRRNSDSAVVGIDKNKGRGIIKGKQSLSPRKLRKEQVYQFLSSDDSTIRHARRSSRRRHTVAECVPPEEPRPAHQPHRTCPRRRSRTTLQWTIWRGTWRTLSSYPDP